MKTLSLLIVIYSLFVLCACHTFRKEDTSYMWWRDKKISKEEANCMCDPVFDKCYEKYCKDDEY